MANPRTIAKLEARIKERVAHCLQFELNDPRSSFVTVTKVELSKDLAHAKVFWSHYGSESERRRVEGMLEHASGFVQHQLAGSLQTRTVPRLRWVHDASLANAAEMDRLIREARRRDAAIRGEPFTEPEPVEPAPAPGDDDPAESDEPEEQWEYGVDFLDDDAR